MILKKHSVTISESGEISYHDVKSFKQDLLNNKGSEACITVEKKKKHRSGGQNRYFHAVICVMFGELMGCSADEAKDTLKLEFLRKPLECGKWTITQTSDLSTVEFEEFCGKCRMLASQMFNAYLPLPNECSY